jgi:hypothetical protein
MPSDTTPKLLLIPREAARRELAERYAIDMTFRKGQTSKAGRTTP